MGCRTALLAAVLAGVIHLVLGVLVLAHSHPNEDAYILFTYVENVVAGEGIAYYPGGPPTAGVTDFLWFGVLAAVHALGVDVAVAAVLSNATGAGLATWLMTRRIGKHWSVPFLALYVVGFHGAMASLAGFSALFFSALVLLGVTLVLEGKERILPPLALVLALVRPEGVAAGAGLVALGVPIARRNGRLRRFSGLTGLVIGLGAAYLLWRDQYFGVPFPLSVYVKGGAGLAGLANNLKWLRIERGPLPFLLAVGLAAAAFRMRVPVGRRVVASLPALLTLVPLSFSDQSQNVSWRFQAPVTLAIAFTASLYLRDLEQRLVAAGRRAGACGVRLLLVMALLPALILGARRTGKLLAGGPQLHTYSFAPVFGSILGRDATIALTEAGILAFYTDCKTIDLLGLNDVRFARRAPTLEDLTELSPTVVAFNAYRTLDSAAWGWGASRHVRIPEAMLARSIKEIEPNRAQRVALVCARFLSQDAGYELHAVREGRNLLVYGFARRDARCPTLTAALAACCEAAAQPGYLGLGQQ